MTKSEMNQLRPNQRIVFVVAKTATRGRVLSVWHDDMIQVEWSDGTRDNLEIDDDNAKHLKRALSASRRSFANT